MEFTKTTSILYNDFLIPKQWEIFKPKISTLGALSMKAIEKQPFASLTLSDAIPEKIQLKFPLP
jgi:hypothetical protein